MIFNTTLNSHNLYFGNTNEITQMQRSKFSKIIQLYRSLIPDFFKKAVVRVKK